MGTAGQLDPVVAQLGAPSTWEIDPGHSTVGFSVRHLMVSKVRGVFEKFSGTITVDEHGVPSVVVEVDTASLSTSNEARDQHVASADFLDVATHPTAVFSATGVESRDGAFALVGDLTIRGTTRPVEIAVEFNGVNPGMGAGPVAGFEGQITLSRKQFGVDLEMPLEGGGVVIGDRITLELEIEASRSS